MWAFIKLWCILSLLFVYDGYFSYIVSQPPNSVYCPLIIMIMLCFS